MALKGLDIFKLSPKKNCKECGCPTCMAFCMKVAQGAASIDKCPHMSADALALLSDQTAPPMKTIEFAGHKLGGETVMFRHEKTFNAPTLYGVFLCDGLDETENDARIAKMLKVDYDRIGEHMHVETIFVNHADGKTAEDFIALIEKAKATGRAMILNVSDADTAAKALDAAAGTPVILNGANAGNYEAMNSLATAKNVTLGVYGETLDALYDTVTKLEGLGNKNLILNVSTNSVKEAFADVVKIRRAALKNNDRAFGYPTIVNLHKIARDDAHMQAGLVALFTARYGSVVVLDEMDYAKALPLYGLRQNLFTDPQKPMKVEPGVYPLNGAGPDDICAVTVDFALTYFVVSGEIERSNVPVNLLISDAGGYSVLTAWAAGKFSASSIAKFIEENGIEEKIHNHTLLLPGKVAVLKGELEAKLPGWKIEVSPKEAVQLVKYLKDRA